MGYTSLQIGEILLKADRTMYKIGAIAYNNMFAENDETLDYQRDIIYIYKKAVEYGDDFFVGTEKLDKIVERLAGYIAIYDYGQLTPVYADNVTIITTWSLQGLSLNDLTDVTLNNVLDKQYLRYDSSSGQWVNFGAASNIRSSQSFTATAGQTTFTTTAPFEANLIDVYLNGVKLNTSSYTVFGQHSIILNDASLAGDIMDVIIYDPVSTIVNPPSQAGNAGKFLTTDGYSLSWAANPLGTVTSVDLSMPTGFAVSNNPVTTSGTLTVVFSAGYSLPTTASQTNWNTAYTFVSNFPSQTGNNGKYLTTNGSVLSWSTVDALPSQAGNAGKYLTTDGVNASWAVLNLAAYVPTSRTLTINGTTYDLSANRTWSVGTVTSVDMSVPTGLAISGNPITGAGTLALTYASGYSMPTNIKQSNWDDAYTWVAAFPTQTGNSGKYLTTNGSVLSWGTIDLSGYVPTSRTLTINGTTYDLTANRTWSVGTVTSVQLSAGTGISLSGTNPITSSGTITVTNSAPDQIVTITAGENISVTGTYPNFTVSAIGETISSFLLMGA